MTAAELPKVLELPALPGAPASDLQALLRRFLEYADWSVLPPLFDCLRDDGRHADLSHLRQWVGRIAKVFIGMRVPAMSGYSWRSHCETVIAAFWFDLFDLNGTTNYLLTRRIDSVTEEPGLDEMLQATAIVMTAECAIQQGAEVAVDYETNTVRLYPVLPEEGA